MPALPPSTGRWFSTASMSVSAAVRSGAMRSRLPRDARRARARSRRQRTIAAALAIIGTDADQGTGCSLIRSCLSKYDVATGRSVVDQVFVDQILVVPVGPDQIRGVLVRIRHSGSGIDAVLGFIRAFGRPASAAAGAPSELQRSAVPARKTGLEGVRARVPAAAQASMAEPPPQGVRASTPGRQRRRRPTAVATARAVWGAVAGASWSSWPCCGRRRLRGRIGG